MCNLQLAINLKKTRTCLEKCCPGRSMHNNDKSCNIKRLMHSRQQVYACATGEQSLLRTRNRTQPQSSSAVQTSHCDALAKLEGACKHTRTRTRTPGRFLIPITDELMDTMDCVCLIGSRATCEPSACVKQQTQATAKPVESPVEDFKPGQALPFSFGQISLGRICVIVHCARALAFVHCTHDTHRCTYARAHNGPSVRCSVHCFCVRARSRNNVQRANLASCNRSAPRFLWPLGHKNQT